MIDVIFGMVFGFSIVGLFVFFLYLVLDYTRLRLIRFKAEGNDYWEIAFSKDDFRCRLNGRMAEVIMPEEPIVIRWFRYWSPLKGKSI